MLSKIYKNIVLLTDMYYYRKNYLDDIGGLSNIREIKN